MKYFYWNLILLLTFQSAFSQIGGENSFEFLSLPASARITAMGGSYISCIDRDLGLALQNPAALTPALHRYATFGHMFYYGRVQYGQFGYAHHVPKAGTFSGSMKYIGYGSIPKTDEAGVVIGSFNPMEFSVQGGYGRDISKKYRVGANLKFAYSSIDVYQSVGMTLDLAAAYNDTARKMSATLLIRDIGFQFNPYVKGGRRNPMPFDIQIGFSKRFKFVPFRISVIAHNLFRWNIRYDDPNAEVDNSILLDSSQTKPKSYVFDKIARHFIIGGEFYLGKPVRLSFAYNHMHRMEHAFENRKSLAGFSFGAGLNIKQFDVSYGMQFFARGFIGHHIQITINTAGFKKVVNQTEPKPSKEERRKTKALGK